MQEFFQNTILPAVMKFVNTKAIRAIKDGMVYSTPLIIVGAVYLLLFQLPIESLANLVTNSGLVPFLSHGYTSTFQITALISAIGIAYQWAKNDGFEPLSAGIISAAAFLILIPDVVAGAGPDGADVAGLDKTWLAGQGMIGAIIGGLLTGFIYCWFLKKDIRIKMPEGVPDGVAAAFTGLIPAACILTGAVIIYGICVTAAGQTPIELIYTFLQVPLQGITDSLGGTIAYATLIPLLWFFGVHGATVVGSVMSPILQANMLENAALNDAGNLTLETGHILTEPLMTCCNAITGSGITMGLVIFMMFFAKSAQMKQIGKLGFGSGIFNINEPILFGTPIVMNPKMLIPFVAVPLIADVGGYLLTAIGFLPLTTGVTVPWTTPPILMGFLIGGWQMALYQIAILAMSFFVYLPFARSLDQEYYAMEAAEDAA